MIGLDMCDRRHVFLAIWCIAVAATLVAWTASYHQERYVVYDRAWDTISNDSSAVSDPRAQFFVTIDPSRQTGSGGPGLHHRYTVVGSSRGEIFLGCASRFYHFFSKSNWYGVVPRVKEGWTLLSKDYAIDTVLPYKFMPRTSGFGATLAFAPKGELSSIDISRDWVSTFLDGCYGIFSTSGGDHYNISFIFPYWGIELFCVCGLARSVLKWKRTWHRGFAVA
jgi:hypothetical protein